MRLAYLAHHDIRKRFGGCEVYALHLARAARDAGHEVLVIARGDGRGEALREEVDDGIRYAILDAEKLVPPDKRFVFQESFDNPRAYIHITRVLTEFAADHLHIHHFLTTSAGVALWAQQNNLPITATLHDYWAFCHRLTWQMPDGRPCEGANRGLRCRHCGRPEYNKWPGNLLQPLHAAGFVWRNFLLRRAYRTTNATFVPSQAVLKAHRDNGYGRAKLVHRPYGLPAAAPLSRLRPRTPLVVGFIGRLAPEKGIEVLIDATALGNGFEVRLFGHGEPGYVETLRARARGKLVAFAGSFDHAQLPRVLEEVDVVAVPSVWRENLPLAVLEAAQTGTPVLVSGLGGLRETALLCGAGVVSENTPTRWAKALGDLAASAEAWWKLQAGMHYEQRIEDDLAAHLAAGEHRA